MNQNTPTVGSAFAATANNFDLIRLFAALLVLFSHSYAMTRTAEPISRLGYSNGGDLAVSIFFVISGFLVTRSVLERDIATYIVSRALRIIPALAAVAIFQVIVIGPIFTKLSVFEYFTTPETSEYLKTILIFDIHFRLPGLFEDLPVRGVNGSLWTLPVETACYLVLPFLAIFGLLRPRIVLLLVAATAIGLLIGIHGFGLSWAKAGPTLFGSVNAYPFLKYALFFVAGSALWVHRMAIPLNGGMASCCLVLLYAGSKTQISPALIYLTLPYLVLYAALAAPIATSAMKRMGDLSYGSYLYAFPIQQSLVQFFGPSIGPTTLTLLAAPIVLGLAWLSFRFVEKPALKLKHVRLQRKEQVEESATIPIRAIAPERQAS